MSEELLKLADDWLAPRMVPSTPYLLIRDLAARVRELEVERMTRGNVMGRIAAAVFGDQNNRTDEECVAAIAELGYGLTGARLRAERAEAERDALKEDAERYRWLRGYAHAHSERWSRWNLQRWDGRSWHSLERNALDAAIDAARKEGEG